MSKKKTVYIRKLIEEVNHKNRNSTCSPLTREGWNHLLECVLHAAGVYEGYSYLRSRDIPPGQLPGIAPLDKPLSEGPFKNVYPDETRRCYNIHHSLEAVRV